MTAPVLVVLDDDPTGTQTVHDVPVLTGWSTKELRAEFERGSNCFFILTNSRALPPKQAADLNRELASNLREASQGTPFVVTSRSDSTLRGHFPLETDVLTEILGPFDATFLVPYFEAGGRVTIEDVHYIREAEGLVPVNETPFARDPAFGFRSANLKDYVEEKTGGRVKRDEVVSIPLGMPEDNLQELLLSLEYNRYVVVNAAQRTDLVRVCSAITGAEAAGKRFLFRTAAEFVAVRIGQDPAPLLDSDRLGSDPGPGLIVAGSYVPKTTLQLERLRQESGIATVVIEVSDLLDTCKGDSVVKQAMAAINDHLAAGENVLLMTSRTVVGHDNPEASLVSGRQVSDALVRVVGSLQRSPSWIIAKGGITSSDIATKAIGIRRSMVAGQLLPGVPVWMTGRETRYPGIPYVVFPGNVGDERSLAEAYRKLTQG